MYEIFLNFLFVIIGIAMLTFGADRLVIGASSIAKTYRISITLIGLTVVAIGTSAPELAAGIAAAYMDDGEIILGNVIGSNIANVGMVIGIAALLGAALTLKKGLDIYLMLFFSVLCILISVDGIISHIDGIILIVFLILYMLYTMRNIIRKKDDIRTKKENQARISRKPVIKNIIFILIGFALLYAGSIFTIENAISLAEYLNISSHIIGISVIAIGTSLPELITTIMAIRRGHVELGIANIIGSNIMNILLILGVVTLISEITVKSVIFTDYYIMLLFSLALLIPLIKTYVKIRKIYGAVLIMGYVMYIAIFLFNV